nr:hypothetical protein Iba_chr01dCG6910 [Ipomoea batatas]
MEMPTKTSKPRREAKISGLQGSIFGFIRQQEILWLKISVHHAHKMANVHDIHNRPTQRGSSLFAIMPSSNDPIKQLSTSTQLHHKINTAIILISTFKGNNIRLPTQMLHNLNLSSHVILISLGLSLPKHRPISQFQSPRKAKNGIPLKIKKNQELGLAKGHCPD